MKNVNLLAEGSYSKGSELTDGYPEFTYGVLKKLGWDKDLTAAELATINKIGGNNPDGVGWAVDLSGGIIRVTLEHGVMAYGNGKARAVAWNLPDPVPVHREPIYTPRPELVAKYPTRPDGRQFRMANLGFSIQKAAVDKGLAKQFPIILTSGRLVEYEGGGEETRSNKWLAELQQDMFVEVNTVRCRRARHQGRRLGLGARSGKRLEGAGQGAGHRPGRQGRGVHAVPLLRLVPGRRSARQISEGLRSDRARRKREHDHQLRLRSGHRHARGQGDPVPDSIGVRGE